VRIVAEMPGLNLTINPWYAALSCSAEAAGASTGNAGSDNISNAGSNNSHNTMHPFLVGSFSMFAGRV